MSSSSSQPIMASSSSQPIMASSSSQLIMASSSRQTNMASTSSQPFMASSSSQSMDDLTKYMPLHKSILEGDLKSVQRLCDSDDHALEARMTVNFDTALHVAVRTGSTVNHIVEYLVNKMSEDQMILKNSEGSTVLSVAAIVGNVQAAKKIITKRLDLHKVANNSGWIPLMEAARHAQKEMITYLLPVSEKYLTSVHHSEDKINVFVNFLIFAGFHDLALDLVRRYSRLATTEMYGDSLLNTLAGQPSAFPSGVLSRKDQRQERASMHVTTLQLLKCLCKEITSNLEHERASSILKRPLLLAVELGVHEVVEEIIKSFPDAIWFSDDENHNALQIAVLNRRVKVFNLLKQMSGCKNLLMMSEDTSGNNILHLVGRLAPEYQLNRIRGAALQMQHELQWYQEVERHVPPAYKKNKNPQGKIPGMVFTEAHKELIKEGEKWMKAAAASCSVVAALIATVVFAAAITVPGGNSNDGKPIFYKQAGFIVFGFLDVLSFVSSVGAITTFLSILTARYAEADFLYILPKRLIRGLFTLFVSLSSMMGAFGATVAIVFLKSASRAYLVLLYLLLLLPACLPVFFFVSAQYPLFKDLITSTYGHDIFGTERATSFIKGTIKILLKYFGRFLFILCLVCTPLLAGLLLILLILLLIAKLH